MEVTQWSRGHSIQATLKKWRRSGLLVLAGDGALIGASVIDNESLYRGEKDLSISGARERDGQDEKVYYIHGLGLRVKDGMGNAYHQAGMTGMERPLPGDPLVTSMIFKGPEIEPLSDDVLAWT